MARTFQSVGNYTDKSLLLAKLKEMKDQGYQRIGASGSKLPHGGVFDVKITGYTLIEGSDDSTGAKSVLCLYTFDTVYKGDTITDTVLSSEEGNKILEIGTEKRVQQFTDGKGRLLNRFVTVPEGAESMPPEPLNQENEGTMKTVGQNPA